MSFFKNLFASKSQISDKLTAMLPMLQDVREKLSHLYKNPGIETIVQFFEIMSGLQDQDPILPLIEECKKSNKPEVAQLKEKLETIRTHYNRAGREPYGWNRTQKGEPVTDEKVFLGNIYGLFTKTVAYWKTQKNEHKGGWGYKGMENLNAYDVVNCQAAEFMESHKPVLQLITSLS